MTGFPADWLALREPADHRARNAEVANAVLGWFTLRDHISVVDLGSGTGSNLRATASLLPHVQIWTLVEHDADLIAAAKPLLRAWADTSHAEGEALVLTKGPAKITVHFSQLDVARDPSAVLGDAPDLVTAAAMFDLISESYIMRLAREVAARRAAFYSVLTYNGVERWSPHRPADGQVTAGFLRHQLRDKGFGPASGPMAAANLADQFRLNGYTVTEGDSSWQLAANDRLLIEELLRGHAMAVLENKSVDAKTVESWVKVKRTGAIVGHTDTFAVPA